MQHFIIALSLLILTSITTHAQCDKKVAWKASKAEIINTDGEVVDTKEGTIVITTTQTNITVEIKEHPDDILTGVVKEVTCNWKEAFKNGKMVAKIDMSKSNGDASSATLTVEGKDGKITIVLEIEKMEGKKIRIAVDKYEEG